MHLQTFITLGLTFATVFLYVIVRRLLGGSRPKREPPPIQGFAMADLHRLCQEGKLSLEEFERAKAWLVAQSPDSVNQNTGHAFAVLPVKGDSKTNS